MDDAQPDARSMNVDLVRGWIAGVTGLVLAGEAAMLAIGTMSGDAAAADWLQASYLQLGADIALGIAMFVLAFKPWDSNFGWTLSVVAGVVVVTHGLRAYQYLAGVPDPFLFSPALFWVNVAKLFGAALVLGLALVRRR